MAEVAGLLASAVVTAVGTKLSTAIGDQVTMLCCFKDDMEDMKETLESMAAALKDAERRSVREESVRLWLKRLKNAAYDISDMLDDFQPNACGKMMGKLSCLAIAPKITMANKMKKMRDQLRKIKEDHESFRFTHDPSLNIVHLSPDARETTSKDVVKSLILGRDRERKKVLALLSASNNKEDAVILAIYGIGGIGKTTLAQLVFNDAQFKDYDHRIWVYVSQVFDLKKIGNSIISQVLKEGNQNADTRELINQRLRGLLQDKKTLIILDDIWETNNSQLNKLKHMLNVSQKTKVLVTTRSEDIANMICTDKPYKLDPLGNDMCWSIIKHTSNFESRADKEQFEQVGREIAKKCGGVPLAAQALGFLLSGMNLMEWCTMSNSDIWDRSSSDNTVLPSLKLSYKTMAPYLRLCFAYCAIFPKGHSISKLNLIHQWVALDFIEPSNTISAIQLGEKYVRQLLGMSFLQHSKLPAISQKQLVFTMHDLVHDLAKSVLDEELIIFDTTKGSNTSGQKYCRYALLAYYSEPTKISTILPVKLRALHFLYCSKLELLGGAFSFAKCLRVLDLSECSTKEFPSSIGQLKQLRFLIAPVPQDRIFPKSITQLSKLQYLDLHVSSQISAVPRSIILQCLDLSNCSRLGVLPEAIGSLTELQYLKLSGLYIEVLPESFRELRNLVHLDLSRCSIEKKPEVLGCLTKLQHLNLSKTMELSKLEFIGDLINLEHLDLSENSGLRLPSIGNLINLHTLDLSRCMGLVSLPESLGNLKSLHILDLSGCYKLASLPESLVNLKRLHTLDLSGCLNLSSLPESLGNLKSLHTLDLSGCWCLTSLPESLGNLKSLHILNLSGCWKLASLPESLENLKNLHTLNLSGYYKLASLPESLGNLKSLHTLNLSGCWQLASLPESIGSIESLEFILVEGCSDELKEYMRKFRLKNNPISLPHFVVHAEEGDFHTNLHLLENIDPEELEISCLENVRSIGEARGIELLEKQNLLNLTFHWTRSGNRVLEDKDVLGELVPPRDLKSLKLQGYGSTCFPAWLMDIDHHLPNLTKIELDDLPRCRDLRPLGRLPNLEELHMRELCSISKIDGDFCGGKGAFRRLLIFALTRMEQLEEWNTTYIGEDGVEEFMFPVLDTLIIYSCPMLILKPRPPVFHKEWDIWWSEKVISSWGESDHVRHSPSSTPACTKLLIRYSELPSDEWRLLHHLPTLQELRIFSCDNLTSLPDSVRHLASLRSLELRSCEAISTLPEWLGDLTSLQVLEIVGCRSIKSLPPCIQQLTNLQRLSIWHNTELERWCRSEENKMKLAHIREVASPPPYPPRAENLFL